MPEFRDREGVLLGKVRRRKDSGNEVVEMLRYNAPELAAANVSVAITLTHGPVYELPSKIIVKDAAKKPQTKRMGAYEEVVGVLSQTNGCSPKQIADRTSRNVTFVYDLLSRAIDNGVARKEDTEDGVRYFSVKKDLQAPVELAANSAETIDTAHHTSESDVVDSPAVPARADYAVPGINADEAHMDPSIDWSARETAISIDSDVAMVLRHYDALKNGGATEKELRQYKGFRKARDDGYLQKHGDVFVLSPKGTSTRSLM